jgi:hypothetical protein
MTGYGGVYIYILVQLLAASCKQSAAFASYGGHHATVVSQVSPG